MTFQLLSLSGGFSSRMDKWRIPLRPDFTPDTLADQLLCRMQRDTSQPAAASWPPVCTAEAPAAPQASITHTDFETQWWCNILGPQSVGELLRWGWVRLWQGRNCSTPSVWAHIPPQWSCPNTEGVQGRAAHPYTQLRSGLFTALACQTQEFGWVSRWHPQRAAKHLPLSCLLLSLEHWDRQWYERTDYRSLFPPSSPKGGAQEGQSHFCQQCSSRPSPETSCSISSTVFSSWSHRIEMDGKNHSVSMPNSLLLFYQRIYWTWHTAKKIWFPLGDGNSQIHVCKATEIQMRNYTSHQWSKRVVFPTALLLSSAASTRWPTPPTGVQSLQISLP